ncbi:MAG: chorismate synthase [Legionellales bacterium]|jgi:chorismate synthase|nr:chorismate synthase [Legionellales bacterium]
MASNSFGNHFRITTWGESHGSAVGVVIDGVPAGIKIDKKIIEEHLKWRKPGKQLTSPRQEQDDPEILSGIFEGISTGAPISMLFRNKDAKSEQYSAISHVLRPGHANFTCLTKYGVYDYNGGGRASARETVCRVAAGAVAEQLLSHNTNIKVHAYLDSIGSVSTPENYTPNNKEADKITESPVFCPHSETSAAMISALISAQKSGDSLGGVVKFIITGAPAGLGDPVYEKLEAKLAYAMLSIPASKAFEIGAGFSASATTGSKNNDPWDLNKDNKVIHTSNNCGGILGGISTGADIYGKVGFKPTSSIKINQKTVTTTGSKTEFKLGENSRHDPCVAIRAAAVVKSMCLITLADAYLTNKLSRIQNDNHNSQLTQTL